MFFIRIFFVCVFISLAIPIEAQDSAVDYSKVVHTFNEAWNTGNYDLLDQVVSSGLF